MVTLVEKLIARRNSFVKYIKDVDGLYLIRRKNEILDFINTAFTAEVVDLTITQNQSGSTFMMNATGAASTITLPAHKDGLKYKVLCVEANSAHDTVVAGSFVGNITLVNTELSVVSTTSLTIVASKFKVGDFLEFISWGGKWHVDGQIKTATGLTVQ